MGQKVSMREYAKIRGVHLNAVQTAVKSGRIHKTTDGKIDVEKANQEWLQNTDPSKSRYPESFFEHGNENSKVSPSSFQQAKTADVYYRAMIAAFIETPMGGEELNELFGGSTDDYLNAKKDWQVKLEGGSIIPIFPGDKVAPFTPSRPNSAYGAFVENLLRHIGTGLNIPYELLLKDFSKTNYSSARSALLEAWRYFNGRRQWLADYWATPVYELWLEEVVNKGLIDAPDFYQNRYAYSRCKWIGPGRGWVDPVKEAQACQIRMEIGLSTLEAECASQGLDWEEVLEQRAREKNKIKKMGLDEVKSNRKTVIFEEDKEVSGK